MKKLIAVALSVVLIFSLCSCTKKPEENNNNLKVHICDPSGNITHLNITSYTLWHYGVDLKLENGEKIHLRGCYYVIYDGECPVCGADKYVK